MSPQPDFSDCGDTTDMTADVDGDYFSSESNGTKAGGFAAPPRSCSTLNTRASSGERGDELLIGALQHRAAARSGNAIGQAFDILAREVLAHALEDVQAGDIEHLGVVVDAEHGEEVFGRRRAS